MNDTAREEALILELLGAIEGRSSVTQRRIAERLGVALGLANAYLKHCVREGLIEKQQAAPNRYSYFLTSRGSAEKVRLAARHFDRSFRFYREAGDSCTRCFRLCEANGWHNVLLCGASDLAEIAIIRATGVDVRIVGVYDADRQDGQFLSAPLWQRLKDADEHDACLLTDLVSPSASYNHLMREMDGARLLVPDITASFVGPGNTGS